MKKLQQDKLTATTIAVDENGTEEGFMLDNNTGAISSKSLLHYYNYHNLLHFFLSAYAD